MTHHTNCNECEVTRPEIALLTGDVKSFPAIQVAEPQYDAIVEEFELFGEFKPMYNRIIALCVEFQRIYPESNQNLNDVCTAYKELEMMINLHERLLYPYFDVLRGNQEKHALFDGSIYGVIQVLQNSSDKIRSVLNLKQWEIKNKDCDTYQMFSDLLSQLSPKVQAYLDMHDRYIYPEAIAMEEDQ